MNILKLVVLLPSFALGLSAIQNEVYAQSETEGDFVRGPDGTTGNESSSGGQSATLGYPLHAGSGCPQGSVSAALSPDGKTLSLLFDSFIAEVRAGEKRSVKECQLRIPFRVPSGLQAAVTRIDYRGFNYIPQKGMVHFRANYFLADAKGRKIKGQNRRNMIFKGPLDEDYFISSKIRQNQIWSKCGEDFELHVGNEIKAQNHSSSEDLISTVDSSDIVADSKAQYHIQWQKCEASGGKGHGPKK